jgi:hypothetical protein
VARAASRAAARKPKPGGKKSGEKERAGGALGREEVAKVASAAVRRAEDLLALIERRKAVIAESFYEIGEALREIQKKKLYAALGHASFEAMLAARRVIGATQARKLIQIVSSVPLRTALELGPEKAFALVRYAAATPELDTPQTLVESGTKLGKAKAGDASVREIAEATRRVRAKTPGAKVDPGARDAERAAEQGRAWLEGRGIEGGDVNARRAKEGYRLRIDVPIEAAGRLFGRR